MAKNIGIEDSTELFSSTNVEGALKETMEEANLAFTNSNNVKSETIGALLLLDPTLPITTDSSWQDIINAIGQISTGKKWAIGVINPYIPQTTITINNLTFTPSINIIHSRKSDETSSLYDTYYWKIYTPINTVINRWRAMGKNQDWSGGKELTWESDITIILIPKVCLAVLHLQEIQLLGGLLNKGE